MRHLLFATFRRLFKGALFWIGMLAMAGLGVFVTVSRAIDNRVLPNMGYDLHMDITRWSTPKSD